MKVEIKWIIDDDNKECLWLLIDGNKKTAWAIKPEELLPIRNVINKFLKDNKNELNWKEIEKNIKYLRKTDKSGLTWSELLGRTDER